MTANNRQIGITGGANLAPLVIALKPIIHPLDDPAAWLNNPAYEAPQSVDIPLWQKKIDAVVGVTRDNRSIVKLVWTGDVAFWHEYFMAWDGLGEPIGAAKKRPRVRYKILRDASGNFVRDVFPPRWLLLARLEPEQYAATYKQESYMFAPEIGRRKQIRPDEVPKVYWLFHALLAKHNGYCCRKAESGGCRCFGIYAPPTQFDLDALGEQRRAAERQNILNNPFAAVSMDYARFANEQFCGYAEELRRLEVEARIFSLNPFGLIGAKPDLTETQARQRVVEYYERKKEKLIKRIGDK